MMFITRRLATLLRRAAMNAYQGNTGVVRATDPLGDHRVWVRAGGLDAGYGDCVSIGFRDAAMAPGEWRIGSYSPARARVIARHLVDAADHLERINGTAIIDEEAD